MTEDQINNCSHKWSDWGTTHISSLNEDKFRFRDCLLCNLSERQYLSKEQPNESIANATDE